MTPRLRTILDLERRIELVRGRVQVGGSRVTTRLVLEQLLAQASLEDLREIGGDRWRVAAQFALETVPVQPGDFAYRQHYDLLRQVSLPLFDLLRETALVTYSRDVAIKLGDSALTPDIFVGFDAVMREYYLEGPPLLAVEIVSTHNLREEFERLGIYAASRTPEVWWLEPERGCARQFVLQETGYSLRTQTTGWLESVAVQGLELCLDEAWLPGRYNSLEVRYKGRSSELSRVSSKVAGSTSAESTATASTPTGSKPTESTPPTSTPPDSLQGGLTDALRDELLGGVMDVLASLRLEPERDGFKADLPFAPTVGLEPQLVTFEAFISWTTEAKFEVLDGRLVVGSERGNKELLGLLLVSFGLAEAFALLPGEVEGVLRGVN